KENEHVTKGNLAPLQRGMSTSADDTLTGPKVQLLHLESKHKKTYFGNGLCTYTSNDLKR
ncbi:MAG: hypothetical protein KDC47_07735, partial [Flavobacteriaceae bacterium]|nr:hypothetical protein [Flavobacteriaceae bacterium]